MKINEPIFDKNKNSIIIIERPQEVGKPFLANYCRENIPYVNLYRLYGTSDKTKKGKNIYIFDYFKKLKKIIKNHKFRNHGEAVYDENIYGSTT